ncbi:MFS transporter, partial [Streptomyces sp. NPDC057428]
AESGYTHGFTLLAGALAVAAVAAALIPATARRRHVVVAGEPQGSPGTPAEGASAEVGAALDGPR